MVLSCYSMVLSFKIIFLSIYCVIVQHIDELCFVLVVLYKETNRNINYETVSSFLDGFREELKIVVLAYSELPHSNEC